MKIYTEIIYQMTEGGFEKLSEKSFTHIGTVSEAKGGGTTTQSNEPPEYLRPYLSDVAGQAQSQFYGPGPTYFPGSTVTPFSNETEQALQLQANRATQGSPLTSNAQSMVNQTLSGEGYSQPWFDAQFKSAMNRIDPQVNSAFSLAGRSGSGLHEAARTEALGNAYGQFAGQERDRQMRAAGLAPMLAQNDYFDIGQLAQVGGAREDLSNQYLQDQMARYNFEQNLPAQKLQQYSGILQGSGLGGGYGTTSSPYYTNRLAGGLGGALGGASLAGMAGLTTPASAGVAASLGPWGWGAAGLGALLGIM